MLFRSPPPAGGGHHPQGLLPQRGPAGVSSAPTGNLSLRACSRSPGGPDWQGFFRPARRKNAGILAVLQVFGAQQGENRPDKAAGWEILNRLLEAVPIAGAYSLTANFPPAFAKKLEGHTVFLGFLVSVYDCAPRRVRQATAVDGS